MLIKKKGKEISIYIKEYMKIFINIIKNWKIILILKIIHKIIKIY